VQLRQRITPRGDDRRGVCDWPQQVAGPQLRGVKEPQLHLGRDTDAPAPAVGPQDAGIMLGVSSPQRTRAINEIYRLKRGTG
jgi:hypothetical protein